VRTRWVVYSTYGSAVLVAVAAATLPGILRRRRERARLLETAQ
jgi:hypothetical protein